MILLTKHMFESPKREQFEKLSVDIYHLEEVAKNLRTELNDEDILFCFLGIITFYLFQGLLIKSETWCEKWLSVTRSCFKNDNFDEENPSLVVGLMFLGLIYQVQDRTNEAKSCFSEIRDILKTLQEKVNNSSFKSMLDFYSAILFFAQGQYTEVESLSTSFLEEIRSGLGKNHPLVFQCLSNLALSHAEQGHYNKADNILEEALKLYQCLLNHDISVPQSLSNLAKVYLKQKQYNKAEDLYQQALEIGKNLFGDNIIVVVILNELGEIYYFQRCYKEAEYFYQQALHISKKSVDGNDSNLLGIAISLNNLAIYYKDQQLYNDAELLYLQVLDIRKQIFCHNHTVVAKSLTDLGNLYYLQARYNEAEPLYIQALEILKLLLGDNHIDIANTQKTLANLYHKQKRYHDAELLYLQSVEIIKGILGYDHLDVADNLNNMVNFYYQQGHYSKAISFMKQALEIRKKLLGDNHLYVFNSLYELANLYRKQGNYHKAELSLKQAQYIQKYLANNQGSEMLVFETHELPIFVDIKSKIEKFLKQGFQHLENNNGKLDKPEHILPYLELLELIKREDSNNLVVVMIQRTLAEIYNLQKRYDEAEVLYVQALEDHKHLLEDDNHIDIADSLKVLAYFYFSQRRYNEAEPLYLQYIQILENQASGDNYLKATLQLSFASMINIYITQERFSEAEPLCKRSIKLSQYLLSKKISKEQRNNNLVTIVGNLCILSLIYKILERSKKQKNSLKKAV